MALKRALITGTAGANTAPFTHDIAAPDAGFDSDIKLAIFSGNMSTALNSTGTIEHANIGLAANVGGTIKKSPLSLYSDDNVATSVITGIHDIDTNAYHQASIGYNFNVTNFAKAADTIEITQNVTIATGRNVSTLMLGGDIEANVVLGQFAAAGNGGQINVSHGLGGAPEVILCFTNCPTSIPDTIGQISAGFWANNEQICSSTRFLPTSTGQVAGGRVSQSYIAMDVQNNTGDLNFGFAISNVGASTFTVTVTTAGSSSHDLVFLCLRGTAAALVAKAGVYTTPTATGTHSIGASLGVPPSVLMMVPSRMLALDTSYATDAATMLGLLMSVNRSGTPATQSGGGITTYDIANPTRCRGQVTNNSALKLLTDVGADEAIATINEWQSNDVQLTYSDAPSAAFKIPYLMFGVTEASGGGVQHRGFQEMSGNFRG